MKNNYLKITTLFLMLFFPLLLGAQENKLTIPVVKFAKPIINHIHEENVIRDNNHQMYRFAFGTETNITPENSGIWSTDDQGNKTWKLAIQYPGAQALGFIFSTFKIYGLTTLNVYNKDGLRLHQTITSKDVQADGQQHVELCSGDWMTIELIEPVNTPKSIIQLSEISYAYRGLISSEAKEFGDSESCQVNVNCSEGSNWQDEKKGVARIMVKSGSNYGWCSGSLINNVKQDCTPYFLTAMHCAEGASTSDFNLWKFYFNYEASSCSNPSTEGSLANKVITGCLKISASNDVSGNTISKSDFLLVKLGNASNTTTIISTLKGWGAYWNGWDANNTSSSNGVGIHHPSGDLKKISTFTSALASTSYSGITANTHWQVTWAATTNGHGVTEGGSSGSPIFTYNGGQSRIIGTLSGGSSYCSSPTSPDLYGKMSYHWTSVGTASTQQLKPWLDPENTGVLVLNGSLDPCSGTNPPTGPCVATSTSCDEYIAKVELNTISNASNCTNYTDYSSISTSITGGTTQSLKITTGIVGSGSGYGYTNDKIAAWIDYNNDGDFDDANEQLGILTFNSNYTGVINFTVPSNVTASTVKMRVRIVYNATPLPCGTTAEGEVEDYRIQLIPATSTGPCVATSSTCDEYIAKVTLNTINNSSNCTNYTDYSSISTTLTAGNSYAVQVTTGVVGQGANVGYTNDKVAVWIDWNNDNDFNDANEQIGVQNYDANYTGIFNFSVPSNITPATVRMRVRLVYNSTPQPCGTTNEGEVEDYRVKLVKSTGLEELSAESFKVFPNPAEESLTLQLPETIQHATIEFVNLTGQLVYQTKTENSEITLNVSNFQSGAYFIRVITENEQLVRTFLKK